MDNNILIVNLTRLGDIIQSIGLIKGLKKKYPSSQIHFLAMSSFSGILQNIEGIDEVISLDAVKLVDEIKGDFWCAFEEIINKLEYLNSKKYDLVVNPIMSIQSSYLCALINAKQKRGMVLNKEGEQSVKSEWSAYLLANQHSLGDHSFNLVNIFAGVANVSFDLDAYSIKAKTKINVQMGTNTLKVGFHVGASQSNKTWKIEYFKEVILHLVQNPKYELFLFGGYKETEVKDFFNDIKQANFHNWIGKFKLDELISAVSLMDMFVTNDTGPMHIAACVKVPIINLSLGPVSMWETGAYSDKTIALQADMDCHPCSFSYECPHWNCHSTIKPEAVINLIEQHFSPAIRLNLHDNVLYWKAITDIFGYIHWVPLQKRMIRERELFFELKRLIWGITLNNQFEKQEQITEQYIEFLSIYYSFGNYQFNDIKRAIDNLHKYCLQISLLLKDISKLSQNTKNNLDKIRSIWSNVVSLKNEMFNQAKEYSVIYDFFLYLSFTESNLEAVDLTELSKDTIIVYNRLSQQLTLFQTVLNNF